MKLKDMQGYLKHHLEIAGIKEQLFSEEATLAIHQGSGGLLRKANNLARGALMAAAHKSSFVVSAEHVRIAALHRLRYSKSKTVQAGTLLSALPFIIIHINLECNL